MFILFLPYCFCFRIASKPTSDLKPTEKAIRPAACTAHQGLLDVRPPSATAVQAPTISHHAQFMAIGKNTLWIESKSHTVVYERLIHQCMYAKSSTTTASTADTAPIDPMTKGIEIIFSLHEGCVDVRKKILEDRRRVVEVFGPTTPCTDIAKRPAKRHCQVLAPSSPKRVGAIWGWIHADIAEVLTEVIEVGFVGLECGIK